MNNREPEFYALWQLCVERMSDLQISPSLVARKIGVSRSTIYTWINFQRQPARDALINLAKYLDIWGKEEPETGKELHPSLLALLKKNPAEKKRFLYLAASVNRGVCKIGCSEDIHHRIKKIEASNRVKINFFLKKPGGFKEEKKMHAVLKETELHIKGEWYSYGYQIVDYFVHSIPLKTKREIESPSLLTKEKQESIFKQNKGKNNE